MSVQNVNQCINRVSNKIMILRAEFGCASHVSRKLGACLWSALRATVPWTNVFCGEAFSDIPESSAPHPVRASWSRAVCFDCRGLCSLETVAALGSKHGTCVGLVNPELMIGTHNNEPELINARTWRARTGLMEVVTGRTWPYHGNGSQCFENTGVRFAKILAGPYVGQVRSQR